MRLQRRLCGFFVNFVHSSLHGSQHLSTCSFLFKKCTSQTQHLTYRPSYSMIFRSSVIKVSSFVGNPVWMMDVYWLYTWIESRSYFILWINKMLFLYALLDNFTLLEKLLTFAKKVALFFRTSLKCWTTIAFVFTSLA